MTALGSRRGSTTPNPTTPLHEEGAPPLVLLKIQPYKQTVAAPYAGRSFATLRVCKHFKGGPNHSVH